VSTLTLPYSDDSTTGDDGGTGVAVYCLIFDSETSGPEPVVLDHPARLANDSTRSALIPVAFAAFAAVGQR
jgi:hypothetical protein